MGDYGDTPATTRHYVIAAVFLVAAAICIAMCVSGSAEDPKRPYRGKYAYMECNSAKYETAKKLADEFPAVKARLKLAMEDSVLHEWEYGEIYYMAESIRRNTAKQAIRESVDK